MKLHAVQLVRVGQAVQVKMIQPNRPPLVNVEDGERRAGHRPFHAHRVRRRAGQHAFARAHLARQQHHVAHAHASAKALAEALHVFFGFTEDFQQITHLYFAYLALFWCSSGDTRL